MTYTAPDHYSYKFKFDIEKLPASQKDRIPCRLAVWGMFFGLVFTALGLFEAVSYFFEPADVSYNFNLPEQGKIVFDGDKIKIIHKPLFGEKQVEVEDLYNYLGVLYKVEYYQLGLINRNRSVIELYHAYKNKRVPLYFSTSGKNIRKIWEYYAKS